MVSDKRIMEAAKRSMECSVNDTHERLKRGLNGLATIGSTAPFVGLFGTVIGIINSFRGFSGEAGGLLSKSAGGISEALVTTGLGLFVAVPAVWAYNYFSIELESFDMEMDHSVDAISMYLSGVQATKRDRSGGV
jgi:biopolymer transport protein ExbB/TolQ